MTGVPVGPVVTAVAVLRKASQSKHSTRICQHKMLFDDNLLTLLAKIRELMTASYGPHDKGVLVSRKSPREMFISKDGKEILKIFRGNHPVMDLIISSIMVSIAS